MSSDVTHIVETYYTWMHDHDNTKVMDAYHELFDTIEWGKLTDHTKELVRTEVDRLHSLRTNKP